MYNCSYVAVIFQVSSFGMENVDHPPPSLVFSASAPMIPVMAIIFSPLKRVEWKSQYKWNKWTPSKKRRTYYIDFHVSAHLNGQMQQFTSAKAFRLMMKNPLPLIVQSRLLICEKSSCFT